MALHLTSSHSHIYQCSPLRHRLPLQYSTERSSHRQNLHISAGIGGEELKLKAKRFLITLCSSLMYSNCCNISPCTIFESLSFWTDISLYWYIIWLWWQQHNAPGYKNQKVHDQQTQQLATACILSIWCPFCRTVQWTLYNRAFIVLAHHPFKTYFLPLLLMLYRLVTHQVFLQLSVLAVACYDFNKKGKQRQ